MPPTNEPPESNNSLPFAAVNECDQIVQAFRDFVFVRKVQTKSHALHLAVAEFSRRLTFISQYCGLQLTDEKTYSLLLSLAIR